jgi:ribose 5-phosphate isomerase A
LRKFWTDLGRWRLKARIDLTEEEKRNAAGEAAKHVKDGHFIGLGSGSTAAYAIKELGRRVKREGIRIFGVPTSYQALTLAVAHGVPTTTLEEHPTLDLTIDGADQIDEELNLIKGMGGALTREKIVASASKKLIIVADESKKVKALGEKHHPVPIEVLPVAAPLVMRKIKQIGGNPVLREGTGKLGPLITDDGNFIVDAQFGPIREPAELCCRLKSLTGVVEAGIFVNMASMAYVGNRSTVEKIERKRVKNRIAHHIRHLE